jgi:hypothetical protein
MYSSSHLWYFLLATSYLTYFLMSVCDLQDFKHLHTVRLKRLILRKPMMLGNSFNNLYPMFIIMAIVR